MAIYCIKKETSNILQQHIKDGIINQKDILNMSKSERTDFFSKYVGNDGKTLADMMDENISNSQKNSVLNFIKKNTENYTESNKKAFQETLNNIFKDNNVINEKELTKIANVMAKAKNGLNLTEEEIGKISELNNNVQKELHNSMENKDGLVPANLLRAIKTQDDFVNKIAGSTTMSKYKAFTATNILVTVPSFVKSFVGQAENSSILNVEQRIKIGAAGMNADLATQGIKDTIKTYLETGINYSFMQGTTDRLEYSDNKATGLIGAISDKSIRFTHGVPHAISSSVGFWNALDRYSSKEALDGGLVGDEAKIRAREIMKDAASPKPTTMEGQRIRVQATAEAAYFTNMEKSSASNSMAFFKMGADTLFGKTKVGQVLSDLLFKVVKIPANIASKGITYTVGADLKFIYGGVSHILANQDYPEGWAKTVAQAAISGGLWGTSFLLTKAIGVDNFQGIANTPQEIAERDEKGAKNLSVKIGDKWYSIGYFGLAAPMMSAIFASEQNIKKGGGFYANSAAALNEGLLSIYDEFPISGTVATMIKDLSGGMFGSQPVTQTLGDLGASAIKFETPGSGLLSSISSASDNTIRDTSGGESNYIKSGIPFLEQTLPPKYSQSGENLTKGGAIANILGGQKVSEATSSPASIALTHIINSGYSPSLSQAKDLTLFKNIKTQYGDETYNQAVGEYENALNNTISNLIQTQQYQNAPIGASDPKKTAPTGTKIYMLKEIEKELKNSFTERYPIKKDTTSTTMGNTY
jgi:hypothetical protein